MIDLSSAFHKNGLCFLTEEKDEHSALYLKVRQAEHRVLSDEQVSKLPKTEKNHSLAKDWKLRTNTLHRFTTYLNKSKKPLTILEIGCGNGWFSHQLSLLPNAKQVLGLDVNTEELTQANRVFKHPNLQFVYADIFELDNPFENQFDLVVLNASIQYFPDLKHLFSKLNTFLKPKGEVHCIDSPFYDSSELESAKERSVQYYKTLGFPEMKAHYFHHLKTDLKAFECLYTPPKRSILAYFDSKKSIFPWYRFMND